MFKNLLLILFIIILQSCTLANSDIESNYWLLSDVRRNENLDRSTVKVHEIDHISFGESRYYYLKSDTIFRDDLPYAVIIKRQQDKQKYIEIVAIATSDTLCYTAK